MKSRRRIALPVAQNDEIRHTTRPSKQESTSSETGGRCGNVRCRNPERVCRSRQKTATALLGTADLRFRPCVKAGQCCFSALMALPLQSDGRVPRVGSLMRDDEHDCTSTPTEFLVARP
jgi:hypothetical protein